MKKYILSGVALVLLGAAFFVALPRSSDPLSRLAQSNFDELSCSDEVVADGIDFILYTDQLADGVTFLSGREVQGYNGVSAVNSKSVSYLIAENRAWQIYGLGLNDVTLRTARVEARTQLHDTLTCAAYLPSDVRYGPTGERVAHIRRSDISEKSLEILVARTHEEITDFLTQEQTSSGSDDTIDGNSLLPPATGE